MEHVFLFACYFFPSFCADPSSNGSTCVLKVLLVFGSRTHALEHLSKCILTLK